LVKILCDNGFYPNIDSFRQFFGLVLPASLLSRIIGKRKFSYDLWGDCVNTAARMESYGIPRQIQVTNDIYVSLAS
jgi:hypothetical protein